MAARETKGPSVASFLQAPETAALLGPLSQTTARTQTDRHRQCCAQTQKGRQCLLLTKEGSGTTKLPDYCRDFCERHVAQAIKQSLLSEPVFQPWVMLNEGHELPFIEVDDRDRPPLWIWIKALGDTFHTAADEATHDAYTEGDYLDQDDERKIWELLEVRFPGESRILQLFKLWAKHFPEDDMYLDTQQGIRLDMEKPFDQNCKLKPEYLAFMRRVLELFPAFYGYLWPPASKELPTSVLPNHPSCG